MECNIVRASGWALQMLACQLACVCAYKHTKKFQSAQGSGMNRGRVLERERQTASLVATVKKLALCVLEGSRKGANTLLNHATVERRQTYK